jgi:hypothetical protein
MTVSVKAYNKEQSKLIIITDGSCKIPVLAPAAQEGDVQAILPKQAKILLVNPKYVESALSRIKSLKKVTVTETILEDVQNTKETKK